MEQTINFNSFQKPDIYTATNGERDNSDFEIKIDDVTIIIPRCAAEELFTRLDSDLHDETVSNLEEKIEKLEEELDKKDNKISDLEYTIDRYERKCG